MSKKNKGFTLSELLIVVAVIAVLVAVSIPIFSSQLEKARRAVDMANARNIEAVFAAGINDGTIQFTKEYVPESPERRTVVCATVNKDGIKFSASGTVKFKGVEWSAGGDNDYSRVREYMNEHGITNYVLKSKNSQNGGWLFYTVIIFSDGTIRIASGNGQDDSSAYTKPSGIEEPCMYWYKQENVSNIEKAMNIR